MAQTNKAKAAKEARLAESQEHAKADVDTEASEQAVAQLAEQAADGEFASVGVVASTPASVPPSPEVVQVPSTTVVETVSPPVAVEAADPPPPPTEFSVDESTPTGVRPLDELIREVDPDYEPGVTPPSKYEVITRGGVAVEVRLA